MSLTERVAARYAEKQEIPVYNKKLKRVVYVLPETLKSEGDTYEKIREDEAHHIEEHGKARPAKRPKKPKKPHRPEVPRGVNPAPIKPKEPFKKPKVVPKVKPVPGVKEPKSPELPKKPRRWKIDKPKAYRTAMALRVASRWMDEENE